MEKWVIRPYDREKFRTRLTYVFFRRPMEASFLRPLLPISLSMSAGSFAAGTEGSLMLAACLLFLIILVCLRLNLKPRWLKFALPAIFAFSAGQTAMMSLPARNQAEHLAGSTFPLRGRLLTQPDSRKSTQCLVIRQTNGIRIMLYFKGEDPGLRYGDEIETLVSVNRPDVQRNPGGFDESAWLAAQGIRLSARPVISNSIQIIDRLAGVNLVYVGFLCRKALEDMFERWLNNEQAALLSGLLLGDTSQIDDQTGSDFRRSGLAHLMSASGANVAYVLIPAGKALKKGRFHRRLRLVCLLLLLMAYGFLTGWQASISRAILMSAILLSGQLIMRKADPINSLAGAACLMMLVNPFTVHSAGFWLSAAAVASLTLFAGPLTEKLRQISILPAFLSESAAAVLCVQIALLPLLAATGSSISLSGVIANLPAGPLATLITLLAGLLLPAAWLTSFSGGFVAQILPGSVICQPVGWLADLLAGIARTGARIETGHLPTDLMNPAFWSVWLVLSLGWALQSLPDIGASSRIIRFLKHLRVPVITAWLILAVLGYVLKPPVQAWFLDVGQGDAFLVKTRDGKSLLIDGGTADKGFSVLIPALDDLGISRVDLAIVTHGHADHAGGIATLLAAGRIRQLAVPATEADLADEAQGLPATDLIKLLLEMAEKSRIKVSELEGSDTIVLGSFIRLNVLPDMAANRDADSMNADLNAFSLIMDASLCGCKVLLTADCTQDIENALLQTTDWPQTDILKVAHHGSRFATSEAFLDLISPKVSVISTGPNQYGHPSPQTLHRLELAGVTMRRTDLNGAVYLEIDADRWQMASFLPDNNDKR